MNYIIPNDNGPAMARIKTDDEALEKASALADYLDAVRQPLHRGMRLGEIIDALASVKPDANVEFDFGGLRPTGVDSYRGYYSDLALSYGDEGMTSGLLLNELRDAVGATFEGYKGGEFRMDKSTPVWVANYGRSHGVAVIGIDDQGRRVVIRTAMID